MESEFYLSPKVSKKAINEFYSVYASHESEVHIMQVYQGDELLISIAPNPYSIKDKREIYSLSKSFTSTAIGVLCDEGKLSVNDYIVDLFPEYVPENPSENLKKMQLKHVLSMNTGHTNCVMNNMINAVDAIKGFFDVDVEHEPGTYFAYNTGATLLLSCLVEKTSGMKLLDFLDMKVFKYLGINGISWNQVRSGQNEGGCGLHVSIEDIAKFGQLYLNHGMYQGRQILSREWCEMATHTVSYNEGNGTSNWCSGYGFQFWMNAGGGYRGDGAFGQLCLILPEKNMMFAVQAEVLDMATEVEAVKKLARDMFNQDEDVDLILPIFAPEGSERKETGREGKSYKLNDNIIGLTQVRFEYNSEKQIMNVILSDGRTQHVISAGNGYFVESEVYLKHFCPKLLGLMPTRKTERCRMAAFYKVDENGSLIIGARYLSVPHRAAFTFCFEEDKVFMKYFCGNLIEPGTFPLEGKEMN